MSFDTGWTTGAACPPGMSRPGPMYDCRPNVSGQSYYQDDLARHAAQYVDDSSTQGQSTSTGAITSAPYQMPVVQGPVVANGGGLDMTTLLIVGVLLIFLMKR